MDCWKRSCCDKRARDLRFFDFLREILLQKVDFQGVLNSCISHGFIEYFNEVEYLHFDLISDIKFIASRLLPNVLKV